MLVIPQSYIDAPPGTGKTQLPFTLSADGSLKVFHLVQLEACGIGAQPIYTYFQPQSAAFDKALRFDLHQYSIQLETPSCAAVSMMNEPLLTVQFLFKVLGQDRPFHQCQINSLRN